MEFNDNQTHWPVNKVDKCIVWTVITEYTLWLISRLVAYGDKMPNVFFIVRRPWITQSAVDLRLWNIKNEAYINVQSMLVCKYIFIFINYLTQCLDSLLLLSKNCLILIRLANIFFTFNGIVRFFYVDTMENLYIDYVKWAVFKSATSNNRLLAPLVITRPNADLQFQHHRELELPKMFFSLSIISVIDFIHELTYK